MNFKLITFVALVATAMTATAMTATAMNATAMAGDIRLIKRAPGINNLFNHLSEVLRWTTFPH
jgi:hypothetical protein